MLSFLIAFSLNKDFQESTNDILIMIKIGFEKRKNSRIIFEGLSLEPPVNA